MYIYKDIDETLNSYSNFQSTYNNENYEKNLVAASKKVTKAKYHLKDRQKFEDKIVSLYYINNNKKLLYFEIFKIYNNI